MKAIIFDMDGVLVDSQHLHFKAVQKTFQHFGHKITKRELQKYLGWSEDYFWTEMIKVYNLPASLEEIKAVKKPIFEDLLSSSLKSDLKLRTILLTLKDEFKLAVASSAPKSWIMMTLDGLEIADVFDAIVSAEEVKRSKPFPDVFLEAAKRLGTPPAECAVVEDAPAGIDAANAAGMYSIALKTPINKKLNLSKAKKEIDSLDRILSLKIQ